MDARKVNLLLNRCVTHRRSNHNIIIQIAGERKSDSLLPPVCEAEGQACPGVSLHSDTLPADPLEGEAAPCHPAKLSHFLSLHHRLLLFYFQDGFQAPIKTFRLRSRWTLFTLELIIVSIFNDHGGNSETSLCSSLISWHTASERRESLVIDKPYPLPALTCFFFFLIQLLSWLFAGVQTSRAFLLESCLNTVNHTGIHLNIGYWLKGSSYLVLIEELIETINQQKPQRNVI